MEQTNETGSSKVRAGSSIADELRKYVNSNSEPYYGGCAGGVSIRELLEIADRIDERHEKELERMWDEADGADLKAFEATHIKLPVDADGVPIHIGDELRGYGWPDGGVFCKAVVNERMVLVGAKDDGYKMWLLWDGNNCHHVKPDSWERIIEEAMTVGFASFSDESEEDCKTELVERCKRLAGE